MSASLTGQLLVAIDLQPTVTGATKALPVLLVPWHCFSRIAVQRRHSNRILEIRPLQDCEPCGPIRVFLPSHCMNSGSALVVQQGNHHSITIMHDSCGSSACEQCMPTGTTSITCCSDVECKGWPLPSLYIWLFFFFVADAGGCCHGACVQRWLPSCTIPHAVRLSVISCLGQSAMTHVRTSTVPGSSPAPPEHRRWQTQAPPPCGRPQHNRDPYSP